MEELDSTIQERLLITAYWPRRHSDEPDIGYGITKEDMFYRVIGTIFSLATTSYNLFFEPKVRPILRPTIRFLPIMFTSLILGLLSTRAMKHRGYYQLDDNGIPTQFLGRIPPESIQGYVGSNRKKFLKQLTRR